VSPFQSFRTAAWAEYAEEREEDDQRKRYRTGRSRVRGRASGGESGLRKGTAEGGSDVTRTHVRWLSGNKHIGDKVGEKYAPEVEWDAMRISIRAQTWNDEPEAAGLPEQRVIVEAGNEWPWKRAGGGRRDRDGNTSGS
jgi:hypothetical protein